MSASQRDRLRSIRTFPQLVTYLRDELQWPIESDDFDEITFEYDPASELGIDSGTAAKIQEVKQLRPFVTGQPWGIFFVKFEPKRLPVVALRRLLAALVLKKRASAKRAELAAWNLHDLLFISQYGEDNERQISFAHFAEESPGDLPTLRVLGWDGDDTTLKLDFVQRELTRKMRFEADDEADPNAWRARWSSAFTLGVREVVRTSKELAVRLADLARRIRNRVNAALAIETENGRLRKLMAAFREALIHDLQPDDFADMYAQTISYGLLSARISRYAGPGEPGVLTADNLIDMVPHTNPFLRELFETFLHVGGRRTGKGRNGHIDFDELGISEVVDLLRAANMEAVLRDFGNRNPQEDPVIHFYELFLKEYDPKKRMQRGVFYTPRPVVSYIVRSVHELLQTEFGLADGLADTTTWAEMKKRFDRGEGHCGAGFQPASSPKAITQSGTTASSPELKTQAGMPAPQGRINLSTVQEITQLCEPPLTAGSCILGRSDVGEIVQTALRHFEGQRYHLRAWCVMPNHVHVIVTPLPGHSLSDILHSWKSFTANKINRLIGKQGALWERESFNHLIRSPDDVERFTHYIEQNPVEAGLCGKANDWPFSSCGAGLQTTCDAGFKPADSSHTGFQPADPSHTGFEPAVVDFVNPSTTPFVAPKSRGELPHLHKDGCTYFITWRLLDAVESNAEKAHGAKQQPEKAQARKPAPQSCDAGFKPADSSGATSQPESTPTCHAGFQPADPSGAAFQTTCDTGFQPANSSGTGLQPAAAEFTIADGVSPNTPFVQILDPACGTGTFLVEVIDLIHKTMFTKWLKAGHMELELPTLWNDYVPRHLLPRLHGYELMMAPYAIAHMKIGLKLFETGYKFGSGERARIYLTNALEAPQDFSDRLEFDAPALAHEAKAVNDVKRHQRFTVVIGNPPYSISSQNDGAWICSMCADFKVGLEGERNIQPLSDDYIKFLRFAIFCIEESQSGAVGMITNREYIQGVIHRSLRRRLLQAARAISITDLHGQRGELLEDASIQDENVFEIEKGVAVAVLRIGGLADPIVRHADVLGPMSAKYAQLAQASAHALCATVLTPTPPNWFLKPWKVNFHDEYAGMPSVLKFFAQRPVTGFATHRDHFAISFEKPELARRLRKFIDASVSDAEVRAEFELGDTRDWQLAVARKDARRDPDLLKRIVPCTYRPFDQRWVVYSDDILEFSRRDAMEQISRQLPALICSRLVKDEAYAHVFLTQYPVEKIFLSPKSSNNAQVCVSASPARMTLIKSADATNLAGVDGTLAAASAKTVFNYIYAVLHSPTYRSRYAEFLKIDFPHIPLPTGIHLVESLERLGEALVTLHLMESPRLEKLITTFVGSSNPEVEKVSYTNSTVWLDKKQTCGFAGVPEAVWNFHIGGYQVCEKWLKDRKGRRLSKDDIAHYQKIVVALSETIRLMKEIDETIEKHGGWPGAFITDPKRLKEFGARKA